MITAEADCAVEYKDLPTLPNCTAIRITAGSAARVQQEINRIFAKMAEADGVSEFRNPKRRGDHYESTGYVYQPKVKDIA